MPRFYPLAVPTIMVALFTSPVIAQVQGPSSSQTPYVLPTTPNISTTSILTVGDSVNNKPDGITPYRMVGIPDGLGAYDNEDGTFTLLMNHELGPTSGVTRAHGAAGAFISKWVINKSDLSVVSGSDLIQNVQIWNGTGFEAATVAFARFCSGDLTPVSAFFNSNSGLGTQTRIYLNGEESGDEGRAFAHILTEPEAGTSYQLPYLGRFSWENAVANPLESDTTLVAGLDDSSPGQVYFYIGSKQSTGNDIEKAGLNNGTLYGVQLVDLIANSNNESRDSVPAVDSRFNLISLGDVSNTTGAQLQTDSVNAGVTNFLRPEDGVWDPLNPRDFYFVTTDRFDQVSVGTGTQVGRSRLWRLRFDDLDNPLAGGTVQALLDGTEGQQMLDNMTINKYGQILLQEDPGNQGYLAKLWQYDIANDTLKLIAQHDQARFGNIGVSATAPFNQDEESSGIIDMEDILGKGWYLLDVQAHYNIPGELVQGGQLIALQIHSVPEPSMTLGLSVLGLSAFSLKLRRKH